MDRLPTFVESARLTVRQWIDSDAGALSAAIEASVEHLRPWMPWIANEPSTLDERLALIRRWRTEWEQGCDSVVGVFWIRLSSAAPGFTGESAWMPSRSAIGFMFTTFATATQLRLLRR